MADLQIKKLNRLLKQNEEKLKIVEERIKTENESFNLGYEFGLHYGISELLKEIIKEMES